MSVNSIGDLSMAFALRQRNTELKGDIQQFSQELSTGVTADLAEHLGGSYSRLTSIERDIRVLDGYSISIAEAQQYTDVVQARLTQIVDISSDFSNDLITANASQGAAARVALSDEARLHFDTIVDSLNSQSAGRSLFAGDATDQPALVDSATILAEIDTVISGLTSAGDIATAIDNWFTDPAGFDTFAYQGSSSGIAPFKMSDTVSVEVDLRANDASLKEVLQFLAAAAAADGAAVSLPQDEKDELIRTAAEGLLNAQGLIVSKQSKIGLAQEQIDGWSARTKTEQIGMEYAKGALLAVDPYETTTRLTAAQFQLESLYAVTVRLSEMSLVNFLR